MSDQRMVPEDAVQRVLDVLPGAEVAAQVDRDRLALTRFATSVIHQNVAEDTTVARLVVHHEGRTATARATIASADDVAALVERVSDAVRVAPVDAGWPGLAPADDERPRSGGVDLATAGATPRDRAEVVRGFVDGAGGLETAGYVRTVHHTGGFATSGGRVLSAEATECGLSGVARAPYADGRDGRADGLARQAPLSIAELDGAVLGARAAAKARAWAEGPVELEPGRYEVVLEPNAVFDLLGNLAAHGYGGRAVQDGRSFVRLGEQQLDPAVTIVDDPRAVGLTYDDDGTATRALPLVVEGRSVGVTHDRRSAAATGAESTGHGSHGGFSWGPTARHLALHAVGDDEAPAEVEGPAADSSVAELVAGVERGILVSDFWYTRMLDPRSVSFTGLTRNGTFLVEDGRITRPVANFRFTQSYVDALAPGQVRALGRTAASVPGDTYTTQSPRFTCPALHLASWNFTGGASG